MNWNDLRVFLAIAESGTLAGAARTLKHNHSTVFRRLNALEDSLGARLFDRTPDGYLPTPAGERALAHARQIDTAAQAIERELLGQDLALSGTVRVTTAPNLARTLLPAAVQALRKAHPQILVEVSAGDTDYDLNRREADLALRATQRPPEHLVGRRLCALTWDICASRHLARRFPTARDLQAAPLIGADAEMMRLPSFQWLERHHAAQIVARSNDLSAMAAMARRGVGLAFLPSDQQEHGLTRLYSIEGLAAELWLLTHPDLRNVRRVRAVWEAIATVVDNLAQPARG